MNDEMKKLLVEAMREGSFDPTVLYTMLTFIGIFFLANIGVLFRVVWFFAKLDSRVTNNKNSLDQAHQKIRKIEFKLGDRQHDL